MEDNTLWIFSIVALVIGAIIGFLVGRSGGRSVKQQELDKVQQELDSYKKQVSGHFE
ncbi:ZapG family protein, partial [Neptunomonas phycophila]